MTNKCVKNSVVSGLRALAVAMVVEAVSSGCATPDGRSAWQIRQESWANYEANRGITAGACGLFDGIAALGRSVGDAGRETAYGARETRHALGEIENLRRAVVHGEYGDRRW